jgi:hypothetical protein
MNNDLFSIYIIFISISSILCICIKTVLSDNSIENNIENNIENHNNDCELEIPPRYTLQKNISKTSVPSYNAINV